MRTVTLSAPDDIDAWRSAARALIADHVAPDRGVQGCQRELDAVTGVDQILVRLGQPGLEVDDRAGSLQLLDQLGRHLEPEGVDEEDGNLLARERERVNDLLEEVPLP